jgi:hypothetical protein
VIEKIALDAQSKRTYDENGFLHVSISPLTRVQVAPYRGCEIPGWQELGLEPERVYRGYRPASELSKPETIESVNGIPIQLAHHMDYADNPAKNTRVGSTGTDGAFHPPFLTNSLHIQDKNAIDRINDGSMRELSLAYRYKPVFTPGETPDGEKYDFIMTDISANHLALVDEGRAGHEVLVYDSKGGNMADVEKTLPASDDDAVEKKEVALAQQVKQGAQKLIDLHTSPAEQEPHSEAAGDDDKDAEITSILEDLQKAGADLSKVPGLADRLKGLAAAAADEDEDLDAPAAPAEDEDEPAVEDPDAAPAEDEDEDESAEDEDEDEDEDEPVAETDEGDMVADGLKACGLDGEDPEVQKAFAAGLKYAKGGAKPAGKPVAAQDRALRKIVSIVSGRLNAKLNAAEECRKTLGRVKLAAFDSAGDIYRAALRQEGFKTKGLSNSEAMKVYRAVIATKAGRRGAAMDRKMQSGKPSFLGEILNSINKE